MFLLALVSSCGNICLAFHPYVFKLHDNNNTNDLSYFIIFIPLTILNECFYLFYCGLFVFLYFMVFSGIVVIALDKQGASLFFFCCCCSIFIFIYLFIVFFFWFGVGVYFSFLHENMFLRHF